MRIAGDIQRGLEVIEFSAGAPHLLKGEYSTGAGAGIDREYQKLFDFLKNHDLKVD